MAVVSLARRLLIAIGTGALAVGLLASVSSSAAVVHWPWADDVLLVAFFTVVFTVACLVVPFGIWDLEKPTRATPRAPEAVPSTPVPGDELDRLLERSWPAAVPATRRRRVREQLRLAAVRTIVRTSGCSVETARRRLEEGTWTDDPVAAAFVQSGVGAVATEAGATAGERTAAEGSETATAAMTAEEATAETREAQTATAENGTKSSLRHSLVDRLYFTRRARRTGQAILTVAEADDGQR